MLWCVQDTDLLVFEEIWSEPVTSELNSGALVRDLHVGQGFFVKFYKIVLPGALNCSRGGSPESEVFDPVSQLEALILPLALVIWVVLLFEVVYEVFRTNVDLQAILTLLRAIPTRLDALNFELLQFVDFEVNGVLFVSRVKDRALYFDHRNLGPYVLQQVFVNLYHLGRVFALANLIYQVMFLVLPLLKLFVIPCFLLTVLQ